MNGGQRRGLKEGGKKVQELREELDRRHQQAKSNVKGGAGGAGGGVSLWPAMDDMRLSREEVWRLVGLCVVLVACTWAIFHMYHGEETVMHCHGDKVQTKHGGFVHAHTGTQISKFRSYVAELESFPLSHSLAGTSDQALLNHQVLTWHRDFLKLQRAIHQDFDIVWSETTIASNLILALYLVSMHLHLPLMTRIILIRGVFPFPGWHLHLAVFPCGQHVLTKSTDPLSHQSVGVVTVCGDQLDSAGCVPAELSTQPGDKHEKGRLLAK